MYQGQFTATLPCGAGGFDGNKNTFQVPISNLVLARNVRFDDKAIRKSPGMSPLTGTVTGTPTCYGGFSWWVSTVTQRQVTAWSNGTIYKETGGTINAVSLASGLSFTDPVVFVPAGYAGSGSAASRQLLIFSKDVEPKYLNGDGIGLTAFTGLCPDWTTANYPSGAIYHDFRVYAFGTTLNPHLLYGSTLDDHTDFATVGPGKAFALPIFPGLDGGAKGITACVSYLDRYLYMFKSPRGIFRIDTTADGTVDISTDFVPISMVTNAVGIAGPHAVTKIKDDIWFISSQGRIYSALTLRPDIDPKTADMTNKLNLTWFIKENVDLSRIKWARLVYDEVRQELWYFYTSIGSNTVNNAALILTFSDDDYIKVATDDRGADLGGLYNACWTRLNSNDEVELLTAGVGGKVWELNNENRSIDGEPFVAEFSHPNTDFSYLDPSLAMREKRFDFLEFHVLPTGDYDLLVDITVDGIYRRTQSVNLGNVISSTFDTAVFDSATFAGRDAIPHRIEIDAVGTMISFRCYNAETNEDYAIANMRIIGQVLSEKFEE